MTLISSVAALLRNPVSAGVECQLLGELRTILMPNLFGNIGRTTDTDSVQKNLPSDAWNAETPSQVASVIDT